MKSLKELFRIGHGPSSSHTMGPGNAALLFRSRYPEADRFRVVLYGSLAATGKGHFTDLALKNNLERPCEILWKPETILPRHPNGMEFTAWNASGETLGSTVFYSVGGGAIEEEGASGSGEREKECYPFRDMAEIGEYCRKEGIPLWEVVNRFDDKDVFSHLGKCFDAMNGSIERGLVREGVLPGGLNLARKSRNVHLKAKALRSDIRRTGLIASYAYAVAEENASLGIVVTAPTCGSCGVLPAVLRYCRESRKLSREESLHALATAGLLGTLVKQNGSISGAEVGCQGEIGVACAMAAAACCAIFGGTVPQIEYAAEIGLEHFLGLTCDPVLGLVQIPCIERNAIAANRAVVAAEMALLTDGNHIVSLDTVIRTMLETGKDMPSLYRETSEGGLSKFAALN